MTKRMLLAVLTLLASAVPAYAIDFQGGTLRAVASRPINQASIIPTSPAVLTADYANVTNFLGVAFANGGATLQGTNTITRLVADDCTFNGVHAGQDITQIQLAVVNLNPSAVTFRPRIRFWFADGAGGAPGTYYNAPAPVGFTFNPVTQAGNTAQLYATNIAPGVFTMPGGTMWAGMTFDDNFGTTGITAAELNNLCQGIFSPPTAGSSADLFFQTDAAGSFFGTANPPGALANFGGNPLANFGWAFLTDVSTSVKSTNWGQLRTLYR